MRIAGIDYGDARTGIAVSDEMKFLAQGLETIQNTGINDAVNKVIEALKGYEIEKFIVGYPKNMNGSIGERCEKAEKFSEKLKNKTGLPVVLWDERLTTVSAHRVLSDNHVRGKKRKKVVDTVSAVFILQSYLDSL